MRQTAGITTHLSLQLSRIVTKKMHPKHPLSAWTLGHSSSQHVTGVVTGVFPNLHLEPSMTLPRCAQLPGQKSVRIPQTPHGYAPQWISPRTTLLTTCAICAIWLSGCGDPFTVADQAPPTSPTNTPVTSGSGLQECEAGSSETCSGPEGCTATRLCERIADAPKWGSCVCEREPICGDGIIDGAQGEQCDDEGPSESCTNECALIIPLEIIGCSDGQREGFANTLRHPTIAGCSGGFSVPGLLLPTAPAPAPAPACERNAGDDGDNPDGEGCNIADLCTEGWHVCASSEDVARNSPDGCDEATKSRDDEKLFFVTRQSGFGFLRCDTTGVNDLFGCGNLGVELNGECGPHTRHSGNRCRALGPVWACGNEAGELAEANFVTKTSPEAGGVLCCRS